MHELTKCSPGCNAMEVSGKHIHVNVGISFGILLLDTVMNEETDFGLLFFDVLFLYMLVTRWSAWVKYWVHSKPQ